MITEPVQTLASTIISGNHFLTALMSLGMAWAFLRADAESPSTRMLVLALAMTGLAIFARMVIWLLAAERNLSPYTGLLVVPGATAFIAAFEWTRRVRGTIPARQLRTIGGDRAITLAQGLVVVYVISAIALPELWVREFLPGFSRVRPWSPSVVWLMAVPLTVAMLLWSIAMLLCLNRRPDEAEKARLVAVLLACPLIAVGLVLPLSLTPTATTLGLVVLLAGAMRHAQLNGRRGQFLSRFLSPQVSAMVSQRGLMGAMEDDQREISIVACDLRGFTRFAGSRDSSHVLQLLREYYDAVGHIVQAHEGTIKDYAGDGVLILIGAPVAQTDHASQAITLAQEILTELNALSRHWSEQDMPLGVGIGVASGAVTLGVIGGEGRLEYAAVGQAVNLAARLCAHAEAGEILLDSSTREAATDEVFAETPLARAPVSLKGFSAPVSHFALTR